ncbi:MAG: OFA family MFS transporter [Coriobacteriia bacterium]|nr:OFA family MFS transporter [Coriobacteriia bacterium]
MDKRPSKQAYIVLLAGLVLNLILGVLYSWSIFAKALLEQWDWSSSQTSMPYAIAIGFFALGVMVAGKLQDKFGPRPIAMAGALLAGLGVFLASFASQTNTLPIVVGFGILGGLGIGFGYAAATPPAVKWFGVAKKGLVTGIVVSGFGLASIYIAPLTTYLISSFGIAPTFRILGIIFMIVATFCGSLLRDPPAEPSASDSTAIDRLDKENGDFQVSEMLKTPRFYQMWFAYAFAAFAGLMIIGTMAKISAIQLPGSNLGFLLVATLALGNAGGRLLAGGLLDKIGSRTTMLIAFIGQAVAMGLLGFVHSLVLLIMLAIAIGALYGANLAIFPALTAEHFGTSTLGANYGVLFSAYGIGGIFGSVTAGKLFDLTGSYLPAFIVAAILCIVAALLAPQASKPLRESR